MEMSWIAVVSGFAVAMAATPGPNNTLVTASGANFGFRHSLPLMLGIAFGVTAIIFVVVAVGSPLIDEPDIRNTLKWLGLAYLLWLAWKVGSAQSPLPSTDTEHVSNGKPLSFVQGALLQLINPKLWVVVASAVVTYGSSTQVHGALVVAIAFGVIFGTATFMSLTLWALVGVGAGRVLRTERQMRIFNISMAVTLVASLVPMIGH